ncbi:MAG: 1,4-dihydroxy-2-naphthoate octaprenyltransferase [Bdellovibrionales bacterium]|nr:1,4-dihydroxy-2-naphthoate octaprenyltransferase [Bdellovibrionales bacterium]
MSSSTFQNWVMAARPKTLVAGAAPIAVATALTYLNGFPILWWVTACALACTLALQIATNFFNDAIDFVKGADTESRLGPTRVTASGAFSGKTVMIVACVALLLAAATGLPLLFKGGIPFVVLGAASLFLAYSYTGGPFPLAYLGLGEVFVILFFGLVAVAGTHYLHIDSLKTDAIVLGLQQGFFATVLIVVNNARDIEGDRAVGKMTLAARFGLTFAKAEVVALYLSALALNLHWYFAGWATVSVFASLSVLPASLVVFKLLPLQPSEEFNRILALAGVTQLIFAVCFCLGVAFETVL